MSAVIADVLCSAAERQRRIDPLLPDPKPPRAPGCGAEPTVPAANGRAAAVGWCRHREVKPEAAELAWGAAAAQFWLTAQVADDLAEAGIGAALDGTQPGGKRRPTQSRRPGPGSERSHRSHTARHSACLRSEDPRGGQRSGGGREFLFPVLLCGLRTRAGADGWLSVVGDQATFGCGPGRIVIGRGRPGRAASTLPAFTPERVCGHRGKPSVSHP
jgi:hypothetical protein